MGNVKTFHFAELLLHTPTLVVEQHPLLIGETREKAIKRFVRQHGDALTSVMFYDRLELRTGGLLFTSEVVNISKPIRFA